MEISQIFTEYQQKACQSKSSDLYFFPGKEHYRIILLGRANYIECDQISLPLGQQLIQYIKYQAEMDITDCRRPQVGSWQLDFQGQPITLRVASVATVNGLECLVVRFLYPLSMLNLQFEQQHRFKRLTNSLATKQGLILLAGQMGCGKTSTLHAVLADLPSHKVVVTIEEPVEIFNANYLQFEVNQPARLDYADLLMIALRLRANVIVIGEIRDSRTAGLAVQAALSGHLVLSTIHARSTRGCWLRMLDLEVTESLLKEAIVGLAYQKLLVRANGQLSADLDYATGGILTKLLTQKKEFTDDIF